MIFSIQKKWSLIWNRKNRMRILFIGKQDSKNIRYFYKLSKEGKRIIWIKPQEYKNFRETLVFKEALVNPNKILISKMFVSG